ncbi:hypothetical protein FHR32_001848 [Streptosporangium album]|uniref:GerMN domain-containing protein n=1 Tax=Streptosporangium album TaxID=47479 RepID=A0A7W7W836_9ACTN|nr:hypothetical protein [Streptosporangium album]MBB4937543.1 hypothetical protein [Streptosporangium album]
MAAPGAGRRLMCLLAAALTLSGCGIAPTGVQDEGRPPVISYSPTWVTVYLLRDGRLEPVRFPVGSDSAKSIIDTLFRAGKVPPRPELSTALNSFRHYDTETTRYSAASQRNEPEDNLGYRLNVLITGEGTITRQGLAQITCTIRQNKQESIWSVEVTRLFPGPPQSFKEHTCFEYRDLAADGVRLPP